MEDKRIMEHCDIIVKAEKSSCICSKVSALLCIITEETMRVYGVSSKLVSWKISRDLLTLEPLMILKIMSIFL